MKNSICNIRGNQNSIAKPHTAAEFVPETAVFTVNWCRVTRQLLQWTLEQTPVPLSGILYEQGRSQQDQDLQCGATVKGTSGLVAHRLINLQASRNQLAQQVSRNPFCIYISLWSLTQHLLCWVTVSCVFWYRAGLSIFYTESLSCGEVCMESRTQHLLHWVTELWRSQWRARLSIPYAESLSCGESDSVLINWVPVCVHSYPG